MKSAAEITNKPELINVKREAEPMRADLNKSMFPSISEIKITTLRPFP
jgi:hypothetical protein